MLKPKERREKLHKKIRAKVNGTKNASFAVYKSNRFIYSQIINDENSTSLVNASDIKSYLNSKINKVESAKKIGLEIAEKKKN